MKNQPLIIFCFCVFLFAQEENTNKRRVCLGLRLGGAIGLSAPGKEYEEAFLTDDEFSIYDDDGNFIGKTTMSEYGYILRWKSGGGSFNFAPFVSLQLTNIFAVQTEMLFTKYDYLGFDNLGDRPLIFGDISNDKGEYIEPDTCKTHFRQSGHALIFPILAKLTFRPGKFSIQAFIGPHFTVNVGNRSEKMDGKVKKMNLNNIFYNTETKYPPVGLTTSANFGIKTKSGVLFLDARYFTDLGDIKSDYNFRWVRRAGLSLTVGYEFCIGS